MRRICVFELEHYQMIHLDENDETSGFAPSARREDGTPGLGGQGFFCRGHHDTLKTTRGGKRGRVIGDHTLLHVLGDGLYELGVSLFRKVGESNLVLDVSGSRNVTQLTSRVDKIAEPAQWIKGCRRGGAGNTERSRF